MRARFTPGGEVIDHTAFFGLHLKDDNHYAQFLNAEFVTLAPTLGIPPKVYESLTWGLYTE